MWLWGLILVMVTDQLRRKLLKTALLSTLTPASSLVVAGEEKKPQLIGCARVGKERFSAVVATANGTPILQIPLPARGHGVAISPVSHDAVVFARRPGLFMQPFDYQSGIANKLISPASGRHFYGHGAYSNDGLYLYVSEGVTKNSQGIVSVYDVTHHYQKVDEYSGFGIGPHELTVLPDGKIVVAVGGVHTKGRIPQNIDTMRPALCYLSNKGELIEEHTLENSKLSIRHLASEQNVLAIGQQYRGDPEDVVPLISIHQQGKQLFDLNAEEEEWARFNNYVASIAILEDWVLATSPRGNCYGIWSLSENKLIELKALSDASGAVVLEEKIKVSSGAGKVVSVGKELFRDNYETNVQWDNHWAAI